MARIEQPMDPSTLQPIDLGLVGAPLGAFPGHSENKQTKERASILAITAKGSSEGFLFLPQCPFR